VGIRSLVRRRMYTARFWAMGLRYLWLRLRQPWVRTHTVNCYLHVEVGDECIFADDVNVGDFDHRTGDPGRPIQAQGIVKSPVRIGADCWTGT
jgi:hypothetical protein